MRIDQNAVAAHLLALDRAGVATAERLHAACPELVWQGPEAARHCDQNDVLCELSRRGCACVAVGQLDAIVHLLAPALIGRAVDLARPVVVVAPDGNSVIPLVGTACGAAALAERVAAALGVVAMPTAQTGQSVVPEAPARGRLAVVGIGPGDRSLMVPAAMEELARAEDIVGYETYVKMAGPWRDDQVVHQSANRRELERARLAFELAASGRRVAVVSSGDPGIFAMASAVLEALDRASDPAWHRVELLMLPGVSAAQAAAARIGAPLGHDFCIISLSDNLKPWPQIERRLIQAVTGDFVIALYNPSSLARPLQFGQALALLRHHRQPDTPVVFGRDIGRPGERVITTTLGAVRLEQADMRTVVIIGSSQTRRVERPEGGCWIYTPRWYPEDERPEEIGSCIPPVT